MNTNTTKPVHDKVPVQECQPGESYIVCMNNTELYQAEVVKFHGGCWATVKVEKPLYQAMVKEYEAGKEFDIKVANYTMVHVPRD